MKKYVIIVVTYNRCRLLEENIAALLNQTWSEFSLYIIDNASTDSTKSVVESFEDKRINYFNTGKNIGGAGGFSYGLKMAIENGFEFAWIMDDDSVPESDALRSLIDKGNDIKEEFSFFASLVYWTDGKIFPMNAPAANWDKAIDREYDLLRRKKLLRIERCSFVGCFINLNLAKKIGLPIADFFIYGDDVEYTYRLSRLNKAYLDLDSIIVHKAPSNVGADVVTAEEDRINRFFYQTRNGVYIAKKQGTLLDFFWTISKLLFKILVHAKNYRFKRIYVVLKGLLFGIFFNPKVEYARHETN